MDVLTDAVVSPLTAALTRLLALLAAAGMTMALAMLAWLPISKGLIGAVFDGVDYALAYLLLMGAALPLGILAAASALSLIHIYVSTAPECAYLFSFSFML